MGSCKKSDLSLVDKECYGVETNKTRQQQNSVQDSNPVSKVYHGTGNHKVLQKFGERCFYNKYSVKLVKSLLVRPLHHTLRVYRSVSIQANKSYADVVKKGQNVSLSGCTRNDKLGKVNKNSSQTCQGVHANVNGYFE